MTKAQLEQENAALKVMIEQMQAEIVRLNGIIREASPQNHPDFLSLQAAYQRLETEHKALIWQQKQAKERAERTQSAEGKRRGRPGIDEGTKQQIAELRAQGLTIRAIAEVVGCGRTAVNNYLLKEKTD